MYFRKARFEDSQQIADLIHRVALPFKSTDFTEAGWQFSCDYNTSELVFARLREPQYLSFICIENEVVVGVITIQDNQKITQLFVDEKFRKLGVAKSLWDRAFESIMSSQPQQNIFVKSSTYAVGFYEKLGFQVTGERQCMNGIWFIPMELMID